MGTNYYFHYNCCPTCNAEKVIHIGKSSGGWCFALHVTDEITSLADWKMFLQQPNLINLLSDDLRQWQLHQTGVIKNEEGKVIEYDEMISIITDRSWGLRNSNFTKRDFADNHAIPGPNGLLRCELDPRHCIGHGEGTWDLIIGDFS